MSYSSLVMRNRLLNVTSAWSVHLATVLLRIMHGDQACSIPELHETHELSSSELQVIPGLSSVIPWLVAWATDTARGTKRGFSQSLFAIPRAQVLAYTLRVFYSNRSFPLRVFLAPSRAFDTICNLHSTVINQTTRQLSVWNIYLYFWNMRITHAI
jgi:hypothetical protein